MPLQQIVRQAQALRLVEPVQERQERGALTPQVCEYPQLHQQRQPPVEPRQPGRRRTLGQRERQVPGQRRLPRAGVAQQDQQAIPRSGDDLKHRQRRTFGVSGANPGQPPGVHPVREVFLVDLPGFHQLAHELLRQLHRGRVGSHGLRYEYRLEQHWNMLLVLRRRQHLQVQPPVPRHDAVDVERPCRGKCRRSPTETGYATRAPDAHPGRYLCQRLVDEPIDVFRRTEGLHDEVVVAAEPVPETVDPRRVAIDETSRERCFLVQNENDPVAAGVRRLVELELGVRDVEARYRRTVAKADQRQIDGTAAHPFPAIRGGLTVAGGEVIHVHRGATRPHDGVLRGLGE